MADRIAFLADTHSNKADGSDLPDAVLSAFKGVDLIVHLGDVGRKGILDRLASVAPVLSPSGDPKKGGYLPWGDAGVEIVKAVEIGGVSIGLTFNLAKPDKKITVAPQGLTFAAPMDVLLK